MGLKLEGESVGEAEIHAIIPARVVVMTVNGCRLIGVLYDQPLPQAEIAMFQNGQITPKAFLSLKLLVEAARKAGVDIEDFDLPIEMI